MSITLLKFAESYLKDRITTENFVDSYQELWRIERDNMVLQNDDDKTSEILSSIFCLADLYNPDDEREEYELNNTELKSRISGLIKKED